MTDTILARVIVVLADCHIHPAKGVDWPRLALEAFKEADLFVTLGDMGEKAGLDALAALAPVIGARGRDDEDDPRTAARQRVLDAGGLRIGCVFDPVEAGIALQAEPPIWASAERLLHLFGGPLDALLWASTHVPSIERVDGRLRLNPGSATLPGENTLASFAKLTLAEGALAAEIVSLRTP
jgi:putative phosphoesterase